MDLEELSFFGLSDSFGAPRLQRPATIGSKSRNQHTMAVTAADSDDEPVCRPVEQSNTIAMHVEQHHQVMAHGATGFIIHDNLYNISTIDLSPLRYRNMRP